MRSLSRLSSKEEWHFTITEAFEEIRRSFAARSTLRREKVPPLFREAFILSGYRPIGRSFLYYLKSFFMLHNESMNVWTHFFGGFLMLREASRFYEDFNQTASFDTMMVLIFAFCSMLLHFVSAAAHLTHNHAERTHCVAFYFDNAAVGISAAAVNLIEFSYSALPEHYEALKSWYLMSLIVGSVTLTTGVSYALDKYRRVYDTNTKLCMFGPTSMFFLWGCCPFLYKVLRWLIGYNVDFQWHYVYPLILFMIAASFYSSYFPECFYPGHFDIFGHSHQLFHIFVTLSHASITYAVRIDVESGHTFLASNRKHPFQIQDIIVSFIVAAMIELIVIVILCFKYRDSSLGRKVR